MSDQFHTAALAALNKRAPFFARAVVYANVSDLSAFTVASRDGLTLVEGDRVLLVSQTTAAECGLYVCGAVTTGSCALTRAPEMALGSVLNPGAVVEVAPGGTYYGNSTWKATATTAGGAVIGTNDPEFYPRAFRLRVTLASGTYTIGFGSSANPDEPLFLLSTTQSMVSITRDDAGGTTTTTVEYQCAVAGRVAGKAGTAVLVMIAAVAAGTILNTDNSVLDVLVTNW